MKILILGASGMLGSYLYGSIYFNSYDLYSLNDKKAKRIDFLQPEDVLKEIDELKPDAIINCVAITSFDFCEKFSKKADQINAVTPGVISEFCYKMGIYFIHISTDHYYSGDKNYAHNETDPINILNNYAKTKFDAENYVLTNPDALVLRTSIVGRNKKQSSFLDWLIYSINNNKKISLFDDAYSSFIHCEEFSKLIASILESKPSGLFNLASKDVFSKADFAIALANQLKLEINYSFASVDTLNVNRANSCGLDSRRISSLLGLNLPSMMDTVLVSADEFMKKL